MSLESESPKSPVSYSRSNQNLIDAAFSVLGSSGANTPQSPLPTIPSSSVPTPGQYGGLPSIGTQNSNSPMGLPTTRSSNTYSDSTLRKLKKMYSSPSKTKSVSSSSKNNTIAITSPPSLNNSPFKTQTPIKVPSVNFATTSPIIPPTPHGSPTGSYINPSTPYISTSSSYGVPPTPYSSPSLSNSIPSTPSVSPSPSYDIPSTSSVSSSSPYSIPSTPSVSSSSPSTFILPVRTPSPARATSLPVISPPVRTPSPARATSLPVISQSVRTPSPIRTPALPVISPPVRTPSPIRTPVLPVRTPSPIRTLTPHPVETPLPKVITPSVNFSLPNTVTTPVSSPTLDAPVVITPEEKTLLSIPHTPELSSNHQYDKSLLDVHYLPFSSVNTENHTFLESYTPEGDICYIKINGQHEMKYANMDNIVGVIKSATSIPHNVIMSVTDYDLNETAGVAFNCGSELCVLDRGEGDKYTETTIVFSKSDNTLVNVENPIAYPIVLLSDVLTAPIAVSNQVRKSTLSIQDRAYQANAKHLEELRKNVEELKNQENDLRQAFSKVTEFKRAETDRYNEIRDKFLDIKHKEGTLSEENEKRFKTVLDRLRNLNYVNNQFILFMNNYLAFTKQYVDILKVTNTDAYYSYFIEINKNFSPDISGRLMDANVWHLPSEVNNVNFRASTFDNLMDMNGNKVSLPDTVSVHRLLHAMGKKV